MNPFTFDRPVSPAALIDRADDLARLADSLEGGTNARLSSPRRFGKTSLIRAVLEEAERRGMSAVYIDLYGARTVGQLHARVERAYEEGLKGSIYRAFAATKRTLGGGGISTPVGGAQVPATGGPAERALLDWLDLPKRLHDKTGVRVAVAFDEFQELLAAGSEIDGLVRSVIQHHGDAAAYLFAGSHPGLMARLFADRSRPLYGQATPVVLDRLADPDLVAHIDRQFAQTDRDPGPALSWLLEVADGHPQRAMLLAHLLWDELEPGATADDEVWSRVLDGAGAYVTDEFEATWSNLNASEKGVLEAVVSGAHGLTAKATLERFGLTKGGGPPAAARLVANGTLLEDPSRPAGYRAVDPFLERWVDAGRRWA
jgi:hypothetical protein